MMIMTDNNIADAHYSNKSNTRKCQCRSKKNGVELLYVKKKQKKNKGMKMKINVGSSSAILLVALILIIAPTSVMGLDIMVTGVTCDMNLPVHAKPNAITVTCPNNYNSNKCTFGQEATISGVLRLNGTQDFGISDNTVFATGEMNLWQISQIGYTLFQDLPLNLCGKQVYDTGHAADDDNDNDNDNDNDDDDDAYYAQAEQEQEQQQQQQGEEDNNEQQQQDDQEEEEDNQSKDDGDEEDDRDDKDRRRLNDHYWDDDYDRQDDCPEAGAYAFSVGYLLPHPNNLSDWMATGWSGSASIYITAAPTPQYDDDDNLSYRQPQQLAGYCTVKWQTFKTTASQSSKGSPLPSGATTALIVLAVLLVFILNCVLCMCGCYTRRSKIADDNIPSYRRKAQHHSDRQETYFDNYVSMSDETTDDDDDDDEDSRRRRRRRRPPPPVDSYEETCTEDEESQVTDAIMSDSEPEIVERRRKTSSSTNRQLQQQRQLQMLRQQKEEHQLKQKQKHQQKKDQKQSQDRGRTSKRGPRAAAAAKGDPDDPYKIPTVEYVSSLSMDSQTSDSKDDDGKKKRRLPRMEIQTFNL